MYADFNTAVEYLDKYFAAKGEHPFERMEHKNANFNNDVCYANEFQEYVLNEKDEAGFLRLYNIEIHESLIFSFTIPASYDDFVAIMNILDIIL